MDPWVRVDYVTTIGVAGDFADEAAWLAATDIDIKVRTTQVWGIENASGTFTVGETVTSEILGATAIVVHQTASQLLVRSVSGTPLIGEGILGGTSYVTATLTDAGRLATIVGEWLAGTAIAGGLTIGAGVKLGGASSDGEAPGFWVLRPSSVVATPGTWTGAKQIANVTGVALTINLPWFRIEGCACAGRDGGVVVDTSGGADPTGLVVLGSTLLVGPAAQTAGTSGLLVSSGRVLFMGSASYKWLADGVRAAGATSTVYIFRSTIYKNGEYGVRGTGGAAAYVRGNTVIDNNSGPYLNVTSSNNQVTATVAKLGFTIPDPADATTWDLHYTDVVVSEAVPGDRVYMLATAIDETTDNVGYYHPHGLDYLPKPQGAPDATTGPADIGADDYHAPWTPSGAGVEVVSTATAAGGGVCYKRRMTANKTANGTALVVAANVRLRLDRHTITYCNDPKAVSAMSDYLNFPIGASDAGSGTILIAEGGGTIAICAVNPTTGAVTITSRLGQQGSAAGEFLCPTQACKCGTSIYVADIGGKQLVKINAVTGAYEANVSYAIGDHRPWGVATNGTDRIYVGMHTEPKVYVYDAALNLIAMWDWTTDFPTWDGYERSHLLPIPNYFRALNYRSGVLYVASQYYAMKWTLAGDAKPTVTWRNVAAAMAVDMTTIDGTPYAVVEEGDEVSPNTALRRYNDTTGALQTTWNIIQWTPPPGGHGNPGYGGCFDSASGYFVALGEFAFASEQIYLCETHNVVSASRIWMGLREGTVSGIFNGGTSAAAVFRARDVTSPPTLGAIEVYGGTITGGHPIARACAIYSHMTRDSFHDLTINLKGLACTSIFHYYGQLMRAERIKIVSASRFFSEEQRDRHWGIGELCHTEFGAGAGARIRDIEIVGGCAAGVAPGSISGTYLEPTVERLFISLDNECWARYTCPTNVAAIFSYAYGTLPKYIEIANRRGHGIHSFTSGQSDSSESTYQYCRVQNSYRSTTDRYPAEGLWQRNVLNSLHDHCQVMSYKRRATDKYLAPIYLNQSSAGRNSTYTNCRLVGSRGFASDPTGIAAIRIGACATLGTISDSEFVSDSCLVAIFPMGTTQNLTIKDSSLRQTRIQDGTPWRSTFTVERYTVSNMAILFEDCTWLEYARPDSVYLAAQGAETIQLTHQNRMTVTVTFGGLPFDGATVEVYNAADVLVATGTTNASGIATPLRVSDGNGHIITMTWTNATGGTTAKQGPFRVLAYSPDLTKSGQTTVDLLLGPNDGIAITMTPGAPGLAPTVTSVTPTTGPTVGGTAITISGTHFDPAGGCSVDIGGAAATAVNVLSSVEITCNTPAHAVGTVNVTVTNTATGQSGSLTNGFTFYVAGLPAPTVTNVSPVQGPIAGGTAVTITGTNFDAGGATVLFGTTAAGAVVVVGPTTITCTAPDHVAGIVSVTVTNTIDGQSGVLGYAFSYYEEPTQPVQFDDHFESPTLGANWLEVPQTTGYFAHNAVSARYLRGATLYPTATENSYVRYVGATQNPDQSVKVYFQRLNSDDVEVGALLRTAGTTLGVDFTGYQVLYYSNAAATDRRTWIQKIAATGVITVLKTLNPSGTVPTNTLTRLEASVSGTTVSWQLVDDATSTVLASDSVVDATYATGTGGFSAAGGIGQYGPNNPIERCIVSSEGLVPEIYLPLIPSTGEPAGGTSVQIRGLNFNSLATVTFDGLAATSVVVNGTGTSLTCVTPAHAVGSVTVVVTNPDLLSVTAEAAFTYTESQEPIASEIMRLVEQVTLTKTSSMPGASTADLLREAQNRLLGCSAVRTSGLGMVTIGALSAAKGVPTETDRLYAIRALLAMMIAGRARL